MSKHKWYTISGILCVISRALAKLAARNLHRKSARHFFPSFVFAYGIIEIFGFKKSLEIISAIKGDNGNGRRQKQNKNAAGHLS